MRSGTSYRAILLVVAVVVVAGASVARSADEATWGYTASGGHVPPVDWGEVADTCSTGRSQSPIAIGTLDAMPGAGISPPEIHYGMSNLVILNNGHTIEAEVEEGTGEISLGGVTYELLQFHIHRASEHMIDGELMPAEMHLVHRDANGDLAVLGIMLKEGGKSARLNPFFRGAGRLPHAGDEQHVDDFDLNRLLPRGAHSYYHYSGSLTTPPCSEGVSWWVWEGSTEVSSEQLGNLLVGIPDADNPQGNRRPVQGRFGRAVYHVEE